MSQESTASAIDAQATLVAEDQKELQTIVVQNHLHADTALSLQQQFAPLFSQARTAIEKSRSIVVTDASQKLEIKMARVCRLELKAIRVAGEKTRKEIKEESLRRSKAIDGFAAILEHLIVTEENRLEEQEKFAERQEAARKAALKEAREKILTEINVDPNLYQLADMTEETFGQLVEGTKLARAAEAERKRKEEAERIEREAKEQAERERIRQENERLKQEALAREAQAKLERELAERELKRLADEKHAAEMKAQQEREAAAAESARQLAEQRRIAEEAAAKERARVAEEQRVASEKAKAEREAVEEGARKEKLRLQAIAEVERQKAETARQAAEEVARKEREESARKLAAMKAEADAAAGREKAAREIAEAEAAANKEAQRRAAAAPDKDKLITYANAIRAIDIPEFATDGAKALAGTIRASRDKFVSWICEKSEGI